MHKKPEQICWRHIQEIRQIHTRDTHPHFRKRDSKLQVQASMEELLPPLNSENGILKLRSVNDANNKRA